MYSFCDTLNLMNRSKFLIVYPLMFFAVLMRGLYHYKKIASGIFLVFGFFLGGQTVFAQFLGIESFGTVTTQGILTLNNVIGCPGILVHGIQYHKGIYPQKLPPSFQSGGALQSYWCFDMPFPTFDLEANFYINGVPPLDGEYWVGWTYSQYWQGDTYYVKVQRIGGLWYSDLRPVQTPFDLNANGIPDKDEMDVVVSTTILLPAGEYNFNNLTITNNAILITDSDINASSTFKGVKITAVNLTITPGSSISADSKGYTPGVGPGSPVTQAGASYGGIGGWGGVNIYGSATEPTDLGSGANRGNGGGAIRIVVSGTLTNDGVISADGGGSSSGGSIYVTTNTITGSGSFRAKGGVHSTSSVYHGQGAGGRIAIYYKTSFFVGQTAALGGCSSLGMGYAVGCAEDGTAALFETTNNNLFISSPWRFQKNDEPFNFNRVIITDGARVTAEDGVSITANNLLAGKGSSFTLSNNQILIVPVVTFDGGSTLTLSGKERLTIDTLAITGSSTITVAPEQVLSLTIRNLTLTPGSSISADSKGYTAGPGMPLNSLYYVGASYGGVGVGNTATSTYGSETAPTDLGSGANGHNSRGGGAIRLVVTGTLTNDGVISADGGTSSSGGSIYVTTSNLTGAGVLRANGGGLFSVNYYQLPGGGGRIAIYYQSSSFSGEALSAGGGCVGCTGEVAGSGTVVFEESNLGCTINCNSNVMFLPGLMGSRLYEQGGLMDCTNLPPNTTPALECFHDKELWVSTDDDRHEKLSLNAQGKSINPIYTKDDTQKTGIGDETGIIDDVYGSNIYQSLITDLKDWKQEGTITDYVFIPYDWRLSLEDIITNGASSTFRNKLSYSTLQDFSESFILKKLQELQKSSRTGKVTIIAHSNGGLVAKALIQKLKDTNNPLYDKIDKVILVAVPQVGTPDAMAGLLHGTELGSGFVMEKDRARQLSENMPNIYNLLPSAGYFVTVNPGFATDKLASFENVPSFNPQISQYGLFVSNETELKNFILGTDGRTKPSFSNTEKPNIGNSALYDQAQVVHQILDSWQPSNSTKVIQVAGWGEETLVGLDYKSYVSFTGVKYLSHKPRFVVDGDGTVVVPSALWMSTSTPNVERWWVDLKKEGGLISVDRDHPDILEIQNLRSFIKSKITNSTFSDSENIIVNSTQTLISNDERLHYTLHSPLTLGITDPLGRYTGMDPITKQVKEEIPNVTYKQIGGVQFLSIPTDTAYTLKLQGYEEGGFSLDVDKQAGNTIIASTSFQGIPSSTSTLVTMNIIPNLDVASSTLNIDQNGDGTPEINLKAKLNGIVTMPKPLTVTADNITIILWGAIPALTTAFSGFMNGATATSSDVTGLPSCTTTATHTSPAGSYPITCAVGTLSSDNYIFSTFVPAVLRIIYRFEGFSQPINDTAYQVGLKTSVFKAGSTVPVKFQLKNSDGTIVQAPIIPTWLTPQMGSAMSASVGESVYGDTGTSGTSYRWDSISQQYIYNWSTKGLASGFWYRIYAKLDDGNTYSVVIGLR